MCTLFTKIYIYCFAGIDEDDVVVGGEAGEASTEDMPPLEGEDDDASRMEEVD